MIRSCVVSLILAVACPGVSWADEKAQANPVADIVAGTIERDYLPLEYPYEGTFLSHFFLALEIYAATDRPFIFQFAHAVAERGQAPGGRVIEGESLAPALAGRLGAVQWYYHGAIATWDKGSTEPTVYDLFLAPEGTPRSQWVQMLQPTSSVFLSYNLGTNFIYNSGTWSRPGPDDRAATQAEAHAVNAQDFVEACDLMHDVYPHIPGLDESEQAARLKRFKQRAHELFDRLVAQRKVYGAEYVGTVSDCWN